MLYIHILRKYIVSKYKNYILLYKINENKFYFTIIYTQCQYASLKQDYRIYATKMSIIINKSKTITPRR